jgi:hypothetical protein
MVYYRLIMAKAIIKKFPAAFSREKASRAKSREAP